MTREDRKLVALGAGPATLLVLAMLLSLAAGPALLGPPALWAGAALLAAMIFPALAHRLRLGRAR
jgi:hypothetical protein